MIDQQDVQTILDSPDLREKILEIFRDTGVVAEIHNYSDYQESGTTLHHELGPRHDQSSYGDHSHNGLDSASLLAGVIPNLAESQVTNLPGDLSDLQTLMGGGNLQPMSSYRKYPDGISGQGSATVADAGSLYAGNGLWHVTIPTPSGPTDYYKGWIAARLIPVVPRSTLDTNRYLTIGCKIYPNQANLQLYFRYTALDGSGGYVGEGGLNPFTPALGRWTQLSATIDTTGMPSTTRWIQLSMQFTYSSGAPVACDYYIDELQANYGKFLSSYSSSFMDPSWNEYTGYRGWNALSYGSSWVNYGSPFAAGAYMKDAAGVVHLKGVIKSGTITPGTDLFILPVGYRPEERRTFPCLSNDALGRLDVYSTGDVVISANVSNAYLSLDSISFPAGVSNA